MARIQVLHQHKLLIQVAIMLKHLQIDSIMQRAIQRSYADTAMATEKNTTYIC
ncbi:MAG: hypothetical protein ACLVAU_13330 [Ruminococcus sp.]